MYLKEIKEIKETIDKKKTAASARIKKATAVLLMLLILVGLMPQQNAWALTATGTNRNIVYTYLINEMGLNNAAACGVLANIRFESSFLPDVVGDKGTSYGLCQWHETRQKRLITYCQAYHYDYTTLNGQLHYLEYELKKYYPTTYNYLKSVSNNANGAYNAGYYWCYHFEVPKDYETVSVTRGTFARDKYWHDYNPDTYKATYSRVLKLTSGSNMSGADVKYVQAALMSLGYNVEVDGWYGKCTAAAVTKFQQDYGLTADGKCDSATWNKLKQIIASKDDTLAITKQPVDCTAKIGGKVTFTVAANGVGLGYQWQLSDDGGKTWRNSTIKTASYATTLTETNADRQVRCIVTDKYSNRVTSNAATMKAIDIDIAITKQPVDSAAKVGEQVKFSVTAEGIGLTYQWQLSDDSGKTWRNSSVKTANYTTTLAESSVNRQVRCIVTDKYGNSVTSNAAIMKLSGVSITKQPTDCIVQLGKAVTFTVKASGEGLTYQWQLSDNAGKTWRNSSITASRYDTTLTETNNGRYVRCIVTSKDGSKATSEAAAMKALTSVKTATVNTVPAAELTITTQPTDCSAEKGEKVRFTVKASGSGLTYQWQLSDDAGKTWRNSSVKTAEYATTLTDTNNGRYVRCLVTDKNGSTVTSNSAAMKVK